MRSDWSSVELRYLATLAAVGRQRSFSRAAESLGYTQSAVSQQIGRLERLVGHRLVQRPGGPRPVSLTLAGEILVRHADAIVDRLATAAADLRSLAEGTSGVLHVGCYQSVGVRILPRVLRRFADEWPGVRVHLVEAEDDAELVRMLDRGELDLTFVAFPLPPGPFDSVELMRDPYVAVMHVSSPLASLPGPLSADDLVGVPLISYGHMREVHAVENRLGRPDLAEQIRFRSHDNGTIVALAAQGIGVALISWLSVDPTVAEVVVVPLAGVPPRAVGVAWHQDRYRPAAASAFVTTCRYVADLEQQRIGDPGAG